MAELSPEQKKVMEEQKANCPFCQIVSGKIPATKVYDDGKIIAIMDINPAREGHILVMTKEHYPILPLIPKDQFDYLFSRLKEIIEKLKKGVLLCDSCNYFIANGGAAGQQSPHFMIHVIPRDQADKFTCFDIKKKHVDEEKSRTLSMHLKANLPKMMGERFEKHRMKVPVEETKVSVKDPALGATPVKDKVSEVQSRISDDPQPPIKVNENKEERQKIDLSKITKTDIMMILEKNPMLKDIIVNAPQDAKEVIAENDKLAQIFHGVDIDELSKELKHPKKGGKDKGDKDDGEDGSGADLDLISRLF